MKLRLFDGALTWKERLLLYFGAGFFLLVLCTMIWLTIALLLPFKPYEFYGYYADPHTICPSDDTTIYADTAVDPAADIVDMKVQGPAFVSSDEGSRPTIIPSGSTQIPVEQHKREALPSLIFVDTPHQPGDWGIQADIVLHGYVMGVPRTQVAAINDYNVLYVKDDSEC
jgi:hypothetical protein